MKFWRLPLDAHKHSKPVGELHVIADRCKGCGYCIEFCPNDVLVLSKRFNVKGYHPPEALPGKEAECVNCSLCQVICPEFAIYSTLKLSKPLREEDILRISKMDKTRRKDYARE
jgi:2-oxoglutarate ferredoxin oxidoreductase subunit delta